MRSRVTTKGRGRSQCGELPQHTGPSRGRAGALLGGFALAVAGAAAVAAAAIMRSVWPGSWYDFRGLGHNQPGGHWLLPGLWALVVVCALLLAARMADPWAAGASALVRSMGLPVAAGLVAVVVWQLNWLRPVWPIQPAGMAAVAGSAGLLVGLTVLAVGPPPRRVVWQDWGERPAGPWRASGRVAWLAAAGSVLVLAAGATVGMVTADRVVVERSTAAALPSVPMRPPAQLSGVRWHVPLGDGRLIAVSGRYALVGDRDRVRVLDATTGQQRWQYARRADRYSLVEAMLTADGSGVVALFRVQDHESAPVHTLVIGLDLATGRTRWQWSRLGDPGASDWATWNDGSSYSSRWQVAGGQLVDYSSWDPDTRRYQSLRSFDLHTGAERWRWTVPAGCDPQPERYPIHTSGMFAVELGCGKADSYEIRAYSTLNGHQLWTWTAAPHALPHLDEVIGTGRFTSFLIVPEDSDAAAVRLDAETGRSLGHLQTNAAFGTDPIVTVTGTGTAPVMIAGIDPRTGDTRWSGELPTPVRLTNGGAVYPNEDYVAAMRGTGPDHNGGPIIVPVATHTGRVGGPVSYSLSGTLTQLDAGPGVLVLETFTGARPDNPYAAANDLYGIGR